MSNLTCPRCGGPLDLTDRFCPHCGIELAAGDSTGVIPRVDDSGPLPAVQPMSADDLAPGTAALIVRRGPDEGARFVLVVPEMTAGRSPECQIFLDDVTVSRHHAVLTCDASGEWTLADASSLNGTYVNRSLVTDPVRLLPGDEVQIGKYRFVFLVSNGAPGVRGDR